MGNHISLRPSDGPGKVILSDGTVHKFDEPLTVAELMLEHPQQLVIEFQPTITNGKRATPLPADKKLQMDKIYVMVPKKRAGADSSERVLLSSANLNAAALTSNTFLSAYTGFLPFFARICPAGKGSTDVARNKEGKLVEKSREMRKIGLINQGLEEDGLRPEFLSRQLSGKNLWKPSLDTITEKGVKAKIRHWLL